MYFDKKFSPEKFLGRLKSKDGSTLIWAMIVVVIITLVLAAGLNIVQRQQNNAVSSHMESQAYFSAMSVNQGMINWLDGTVFSFEEGTEYTGSDERAKFINWVLSKPSGVWHQFLLDKMDFPDTLGEFELWVKHEGDLIFIRTRATFNNETRTIVGTLTNDPTVTVTEGGPTVAKVEVPHPPEIPASSSLTLLNSGNPSGATGNYLITNRTDNVNGTMKTLVVEGSSTNITFGGNVDLLIIRGGANVNIGNPANIGKLVIEDGGTTSFQNNSKLYSWPAGNAPEVYVMPGGKFLNLAQGNNQSGAIIYAYATNDPAKRAIVQLGKMQIKDIIVQSVGEFGGYTADIGNPGTIDMTGVIHLPLGYTVGNITYDMSNFNILPAAVLSRVCNPVGTGVRPAEAPFCPHFLALNEPPIITNTDNWGAGGFYEE